MTIMTQTMISTTAGAKAPFIAMMSTIIMHQDHSAFVRKCTISYSIHAVQEQIVNLNRCMCHHGLSLNN